MITPPSAALTMAVPLIRIYIQASQTCSNN